MDAVAGLPPLSRDVAPLCHRRARATRKRCINVTSANLITIVVATPVSTYSCIQLERYFSVELSHPGGVVTIFDIFFSE